MKRKKVDSQRERKILIAMITSTPFLAKAAPALDLSLIEAEHFKQVAEWCCSYFTEHGKAPGSHIENLYHTWAEDNENSDLVDAVHDFLDGLGQEYDKASELNVQFLLDDFGQFLAKKKLHRLKDDMEYAIAHGKVKDAEKSVQTYRSVEFGAGVGIDPLRDDACWEVAFAERQAPILEFEGDAGKFFNYAMTRDALVGIQAPEKTGKTWWCVEFVLRALRQRRKVALFEVGDLSESQILLRLGIRWSGLPMWRQQRGSILVPSKIEVDEAEDSGYRVDHLIRKSKKTVNRRAVEVGRKKFRRACGLSDKVSYVKVSTHANSTINIKGIDQILEQWWQEEGFVADVIVIDYADILAPEESGRKHEHDRNLINDTWKAARRLSQTRHALVIMPTQANATAYSQETTLQTMKSFSEDKRKLAHVTAMLGLNQTPEEKDMGSMRLNWIVLREAPYNITRPLYVGTCFALGRALTCATL